MTRAKWDELVEGGIATIANADYYKDVEIAIAWADRVVKAAEALRTSLEKWDDSIDHYDGDGELYSQVCTDMESFDAAIAALKEVGK